MRILVVHEVDWAEKPIFEMHEFPERLIARGHEVTYVDYQESARGALGVARRTVRGRSLPTSEHELVSVRTPWPGICGRLLAVVVSWWVIGQVLRSRPFDVVLLYGVPTNGWSTCWWGRRVRIPVVYRAIDVSHQLRATRWSWAVKLAERYVARASAHVSCHNDALARYLVDLGPASHPYSVEVPGVSTSVQPNIETEERLREQLGLRATRRVILYRGTLYRFSGVGELIELLAPMLRRRPEVILLVVGEGEMREPLAEAIGRLGLGASVRIAPFVPHAELHALFRMADVSVNPFERSLVTDCALPGRVLQSLRAGTPCVSTPLEGLRATIPSAPLLSYRDLGAGFADEVERWLDRPSSEIEAARRGTDPVMARFDWDEASAAFERMLERVCESCRPVAVG